MTVFGKNQGKTTKDAKVEAEAKGIVLGEEYEDSLGGFKGIAVAVTYHINGCIQATLEAPANEGKVGQLVSIDEQRLIATKTKEEVKTFAGPGGFSTVVDR